MNRKEEWAALMGTFPTPPALADTVQRAKQRKTRRFRGKLIGIPAASLVGAAAAFVLMVNLSLPFALAAGSVPGLKNLVAAAAFSPSLKAAVQHDYYRISGQTQTQNGITVSIQYVIADRSQVDIFYSMEDAGGRTLDLMPNLVMEDGTTPLVGYGLVYGGEPQNGLYHLSFLFTDLPVPDTLHLSCTVRAYAANSAEAPVELPEGAEDQPLLQAESFLFHLPLHGEDIQTGETISVNRPFTMDGQALTLDTVDINPTHTQINLKDDPNNTAYLRNLFFYLEDENGNRYQTGGGVTALGSDTPFFPSYFLESSYFQDAEHLNLVITGANWLEKDTLWLNDLKVGETYTDLPLDNCMSLSIERAGSGIRITLLTNQPEAFTHSSLLSWTYRDSAGGEDIFHSNRYQNLPDGTQKEVYELSDYPYDTIDLAVNISRQTVLESPLTIPIR